MILLNYIEGCGVKDRAIGGQKYEQPYLMAIILLPYRGLRIYS